jgi:O-antigen ligase
VTGLLALAGSPGWAPLSIDPAATIYATAVLLAAVLTFAGCRTVLAHQGVREVSRAIAWLGLFLGCAGMIQRAASPVRIYGFWTPQDAGALPFGPFVNRNHAATWLVMGASISVGYLMARLYRPASEGRRFVSVAHSIDSRAAWLALAGTTMVVALGVSLSRSGALGLAAAAAVLLALGRSRFGRQGTAWILAVVMVAGVVLVALGQFAPLLNRVVETAVGGPPGRFAIWRDTLTAVREFWLAGSGAGTYAQAMVAFQTTDRAYYFNQAHNHFLQVAAEGGLLLAAPLVLAAVALGRLVAARLREDGSGVFWIRAGAAAGLAGVAVQSLWETGLRLPANAELVAVLAALAIHPVPAPAEPPRT